MPAARAAVLDCRKACSNGTVTQPGDPGRLEHVVGIWTPATAELPRWLQLPAHDDEYGYPGQALGGSGQFTSGVAENASTGYGNYNGGFISFGTRQWHGLTMQHNFTYSKALGTGAVVQASSEYTQDDAYNLRGDVRQPELRPEACV
jgi:hypothetical protein